jgi:hypothetical protein
MIMRKIILIVVFLSISTVQLFAQRNNNDRIKVLKVTFITNALDLNSAEAEKFWPVYNEYSKTIHKVKNKKMRELAQKGRNGGIDILSDKEVNQMLEDYINIDANVLTAKRTLYKKLNGVIPPKKIIKLFKAEQDFNKELLKRFRQRKENMNKKK